MNTVNNDERMENVCAHKGQLSFIAYLKRL